MDKVFIALIRLPPTPLLFAYLSSVYTAIMNDSIVPVGLGLILVKDKQVLLARRKATNGQDEYDSPGGALKRGESFKEAVARELAEECGTSVKIHKLRPLCTINYLRSYQTHAVGIGFTAEIKAGVPVNMEPEKHDNWGWYHMDSLPTPLFPPVAKYIESYTTGHSVFDD